MPVTFLLHDLECLFFLKQRGYTIHFIIQKRFWKKLPWSLPFLKVKEGVFFGTPCIHNITLKRMKKISNCFQQKYIMSNKKKIFFMSLTHKILF